MHATQRTEMVRSQTQVAFLERAQNALARIVDGMTEEALMSALSAGSDVGSLARAISSPALKDPALEIDPLAPARARVLEHRKEVAQEAGEMLTAGQASDLLGISRQALDKRRKAASVLGVRVGSDWYYPSLQFEDATPLPRLKEALKAHHGVDGWVILDSLIAADPTYDNRSIIDLLRQKDNTAIDHVLLALAEQYSA